MFLVVGTFLAGFSLCSSVETVNTGIRNKNIVRSVDISTQLVKVSYSITVENAGNNGIRTYLFAIEPEIESDLSYIGAQVR